MATKAERLRSEMKRHIEELKEMDPAFAETARNRLEQLRDPGTTWQDVRDAVEELKALLFERTGTFWGQKRPWVRKWPLDPKAEHAVDCARVLLKMLVDGIGGEKALEKPDGNARALIEQTLDAMRSDLEGREGVYPGFSRVMQAMELSPDDDVDNLYESTYVKIRDDYWRHIGARENAERKREKAERKREERERDAKAGIEVMGKTGKLKPYRATVEEAIRDLGKADGLFPSSPGVLKKAGGTDAVGMKHYNRILEECKAEAGRDGEYKRNEQLIKKRKAELVKAKSRVKDLEEEIRRLEDDQSKRQYDVIARRTSS